MHEQLVSRLKVAETSCSPQGDPRPFQMLGAAIAMGYMYQGPPFRCRCSQKE